MLQGLEDMAYLWFNRDELCVRSNLMNLISKFLLPRGCALRVMLLLILSSSWVAAHDEHKGDVSASMVNVDGVGEVSAEPDQAVLNVTISANKPTLIEAKEDADKKYQQILDVIKSAKIPKQQYKVISLNSRSEYEYNKLSRDREYKGETITRVLNIIINDLDKLPSFMQALVENGISTISSVHSDFQDRSTLQRQALANAIDEATSKAEFIAKNFNRKLGPVISVSEHASRTPIFRSRSYAVEELVVTGSSKSAPQEAFGAQKIQMRISASFKLN